jgi:uncharacterized membrane protein
MSFLKFGKDIGRKSRTEIDSGSQASDSGKGLRLICHRIPARTFNIKGHYFPVCSRCTGLYMGVILCLIYISLFYVVYTPILILFSIFMMIPTVIDGITQLFGFRDSNNILRFSTGLIAGVGLIIFINTIRWIIIMN